MDRCYNPKCKAWPNYGRRGIKVCERWHDVRTFVAELPPGYVKGLEIDRIDNDGNYEPGNIQWSTRQQNSAHRRSARLLTVNGVTKSVTEWVAETGNARHLITGRIDKHGWDIARAVTEPTLGRVENMKLTQTHRWAGHTKKPAPKPFAVKTVEFRGEQRSIAEISAATGITVELLRKRIFERSWPVEKATRII